MSDLKPITFYSHAGGPNPPKVQFVLEELGIPYERIVVSDPKADWYVKLNPNGRLPTIIDPNNKDFTLWESGAILEYLVETYDKEGKLNGATPEDKWHIKQYVHFQMSGQGPYYGQAAWFHFFHPEDIPSAKTRYEEQAVRVLSVLETILKDKEYLVGGKVTYADLAFVSWNNVLFGDNFKVNLKEKYDVINKYPSFWAWHQRLLARDSVKKVFSQ